MDAAEESPATLAPSGPCPERPEALTKRQAEILDVIRRSVAERGFPPTLREINAVFGFSSTNAAHCHLEALERKGYLRRDGLKSRAIVLLNPAETEAPPTTMPVDADGVQALRAALARIASFDGTEGAALLGTYFARLAREALDRG